MPAPRKPVGTQQGHRPQPVLAVVVSEVERHVPALPVIDDDDADYSWHPRSVALWKTYWKSDVAVVASDVDAMSVVDRWIIAHEEWICSTKAVRRKRTVDGSMGQPVLNPLAAHAKSQAEEMRKCEASLGIGPKERVALGLDANRGRLSAAQLNKMTQGASDRHVDPATTAIFGEFEEA